MWIDVCSDEKKFKSLNHLKEQLQKDKKHIDQFLD